MPATMPEGCDREADASFWSGRRDSNRRPSPWHSLPLFAKVGPAGISLQKQLHRRDWTIALDFDAVDFACGVAEVSEGIVLNEMVVPDRYVTFGPAPTAGELGASRMGVQHLEECVALERRELIDPLRERPV